MLWPTCKVTTTHSLPHFPEHNSVQIKQGKQVHQGITTHYWPPHPDLLEPSSSAPSPPQTPKATDQVQPACQPPSTHRLHRGCFSTQSHFFKTEKEVFCLIYINKHKNSSKRRKLKNMSQIKKFFKSTEKNNKMEIVCLKKNKKK